MKISGFSDYDNPLPEGLREFDDTKATRQSVYDLTLNALKAKFPVSHKGVRLELHDPKYSGDMDYTLAKQKKAMISGRSLRTPIKGTWKLFDEESGALLDEKEEVVMHVPYYTDRGTVVNNGNDYTVVNQSRLKPGIYTRTRRSGEHEAHVNVLPGSGKGFRLWLEPSTGILRVNVGQSNIPAYEFFRYLGIPDSDMKKTWGDEIFTANVNKKDSNALKKLYTKFGGSYADPDADDTAKADVLKSVVFSSELDSEVVSRTLGLPDQRSITPESLLRTTEKLLNVNRGVEEEDDRDAPEFAHIYSVDDFAEERVQKDAGKALRNLLNKASRQRTLKAAGRGVLTPWMDSFILNSGMATPSEETNPVSILDQIHRVVKLGEGGLPSEESVTEEARDVNHGQVGFIDTIAGPECYDSETEVLTRRGWIPWPEATEDDQFACLVGGRLTFEYPEKVVHDKYKGKLYGVQTKFLDLLVTPNHRHYVRRSPRSRNDRPHFVFEYAEDTYGSGARNFLCGGPVYEGIGIPSFELPAVERKLTEDTLACGRLHKHEVMDMVRWCQFLGYYLSEGNVNHNPETSTYKVKITQSRETNPEVCDDIEECLDALNLNWTLSSDDYTLCFKQLSAYLVSLGTHCHNKIVPEYVLDASIEARESFLKAAVDGDGRRNDSHHNYCTTSRELAEGVRMVATSLGYSTNMLEYEDKREERYRTVYDVSFHRLSQRSVQRKDAHYQTLYDGEVHCATVPGGLLYVKRGKGIPVWSGNSGRIGIDTRLAYRTFKGKDKQIYGEFLNPVTGKLEYHRPEDVAKMNVAFPGEQGKKRQYVTSRGRMRKIKAEDVDLVIPSQAHMYNPTINLGTMLTGFQPARAFYSAKYHSQFLPVKNGESPLVQTEVPGTPGRSFSEYYGRKVATVSSPINGVVTHVSGKNVTVTDENGKKHVQELVQDFPFNRLTAISFHPAVKVGTPVREGDMLATSNFTDDKGRLSYGRNLKTAVVPYRGFTFEDAYIISDEAAKKMTSERMHGYDVAKRNGIQVNRNRFMSAFPKKYTNEQVGKIDRDGVIKSGSIVHYGDPLILATGPRALSAEDASVGNLHKVLRNMHRDDSVVWEHHTPGIVTDVAMTAKGAAVNVKTESPVQIGDKLTNGHASKGITGKIIPVEEMPVDSNGEPYEMLLNPMVVQSRVAPNQLNDLRLGKLAKKLGEPMVIPSERPEGGWTKFVNDKLAEHGMSGEETIKDPKTGKLLDAQGDGYMYFSPFHHLAEKKLSARETGGYTQDRQPARGGTTGAKRIGGLDVKALLAHGATEVLKDAMVTRGNRNEDYWTALKLGRPLPSPEVPFVYKKFLNLMKAGGVGILEKDQTQKLYSLTDGDIDKMSNGEVTSAETVDAATLKPKTGGLFDESLTGGLTGNRWGHITLAQPVPNPIMEDPIRRLLGLTGKEFRAVLTGKETIDGMTGGQAIKEKLASVDLDEEIRKNTDLARNGKGAKRDNAVKLLGVLSNAKKLDVSPEKWMMSKIPVLPPMFRPLSTTGDMLLVDDMNDLYKDVIEVNNQLKDLRDDLSSEELSEEQGTLYDAVTAVMGWGEPATAENRSKKLKGSVKKIFGTNPKHGYFQSKVISKPVDMVGRGVVAPDPNLDMDTVGIPEEKAWELYRPFVLRKLVRRGFPPVKAKEMIEKQDKEAKSELVEAMEERPVLINRAPSWHKFNIMAFRPTLIREPVIRVSPLVVGGFNMDFDGDTATMHVPVGEKAADEAWAKMRPSRNLFSLTDRKSLRHTPDKEMIMGLAQLTRKPSKKAPIVFKTMADAQRAYHQGIISLNDPIEVLDAK